MHCGSRPSPAELPVAVELIVTTGRIGPVRQLFLVGNGRMKRRAIPAGERGAALLAVLILVAITGAIAAASMEKLRLSRAVAGNVVAIDQARHFAIGAEQLAMLIIDDLVAQDRTKTTLAGGWNGAIRRIPMPGGGVVEARLRDGGNCFNVNSVVQGERDRLRPPRLRASISSSALMVLRGVPRGGRAPDRRGGGGLGRQPTACRGPAGAEDAAYQRRPAALPHRQHLVRRRQRAARRSPACGRNIMRGSSPWLCALPVAELSPINVNTLLPDQARAAGDAGARDGSARRRRGGCWRRGRPPAGTTQSNSGAPTC